MIDIRIDEPDSWLSRAALAQSRRSGRRVGAVRVGADEPAFFMADEVIVDAADTDLIRVMLDGGGRITRADRDIALPEEFRAAGLGRREAPDTTDLPRNVRIQFDDVPKTPSDRLTTLLERTDLDAESLETPRSCAPSCSVNRRSRTARCASIPRLRHPLRRYGWNCCAMTANPSVWPNSLVAQPPSISPTSNPGLTSCGSHRTRRAPGRCCSPRRLLRRPNGSRQCVPLPPSRDPDAAVIGCTDLDVCGLSHADHTAVWPTAGHRPLRRCHPPMR
jgi:hypothetical protein